MGAKRNEKKEKFLDSTITKEESYEKYQKRKKADKIKRDKKEYLEYWN